MKQVLFSTCDVLPVQIASGLQIHSCLTKRFYLRCAAVFACSRAVELFYGVRDVLDLFRSIAPTKLKKPDPYHSAILHNDCFYIAHHLLCLGYRYKASLPEDLQAIATFVDLVCVCACRTWFCSTRENTAMRTRLFMKTSKALLLVVPWLKVFVRFRNGAYSILALQTTRLCLCVRTDSFGILLCGIGTGISSAWRTGPHDHGC
eukprot:m.103871 g.103871  ORF g.103871 m.103871 type:complete len:204 (-) comp13247_c0_seq9:43-654(-)